MEPDSSTPLQPTHPSAVREKRITAILVVLIVCTLGAIALLGYRFWRSNQTPPTTYEECTGAPGSLIQESYPATCVTRDGKRFTQPLSEEEEERLKPPSGPD